MPRAGGAGFLVALQVARLLLRGARGRIRRIEADGDDLEIAAGLQREHIQRARQAADHERAEHRAAVVREDEHDGASAEIIGKLHRRASLVAEEDVAVAVGSPGDEVRRDGVANE